MSSRNSNDQRDQSRNKASAAQQATDTDQKATAGNKQSGNQGSRSAPDADKQDAEYKSGNRGGTADQDAQSGRKNQKKPS